MRNLKKMKALSVAGMLVAGLLLAGCKSAPELTQDQALSLIQAKYDQMTPEAASVNLSKDGMGMGITDGYWKLTKVYPNRFWADYTLTDDGKKVVKLAGSDVIEWRPSSESDTSYSLTVQTVVANHLRARDLQQVTDETLPGVAAAKGADFSEGVDLTGVPQPLQDIAHNVGNRLANRRHADFSLENGAWVLHGIV